VTIQPLMTVFHVLLEVNSFILVLASIAVLPTTMPTMYQNPTSAINVVRIVKDVLQHQMSLVLSVLQDLNTI
jgi:hypothetical protein